MTKKVQFYVCGPEEFGVAEFSTIIAGQAFGHHVYDSIQKVKNAFLRAEDVETSSFVRITIEEVDKEGNTNG